MNGAPPRVGVVVLAWQAEPWLAECIDAVLASEEVDVNLVVVDNGCDAEHLAPVAGRARVLRPGSNLGFAGGCNLGAAELDTDFVALVNSDCVVEPGTLRALVDEAARPAVGLVMASIRFPTVPSTVNSAGNPVHLTGLSWAGGMHAVERRREPYDVTAASGACLLVPREVWKELGGFDETYFAYVEDTDLSLRAWACGWSVRCVPTAVAVHHYEFSRNRQKMYLLERNRLYLLATLWPARALLALAPVLLALEVAVLAQALATGWAPAKISGWRWMWRHRGAVAERRRRTSHGHSRWLHRLTPELGPEVIGAPGVTRVVNAAIRAYWMLARPVVVRGRPTT